MEMSTLLATTRGPTQRGRVAIGRPETAEIFHAAPATVIFIDQQLAQSQSCPCNSIYSRFD